MNLSPGLLEALTANRRDPGKLWSLFCDAGFDAARLSAINSAVDPVTPYSRAVLAGTPECEVMLARWTPGRVCAPHDHGTSAGWVFYFEHDFEERAYAWRDGALVQQAAHIHRSGEYTEVTRHEIHSCECTGRGLSLHLYFPRIEGMKVFDLERRRTLVVADNCGAWIPARPEQLIAQSRWST